MGLFRKPKPPISPHYPYVPPVRPYSYVPPVGETPRVLHFLGPEGALPPEGSYLVVFQVFQYAGSAEAARTSAVSWLVDGKCWSGYYAVIDSKGFEVTVEGVSTREAQLTDRARDAGEWIVLWAATYPAASPVEAKKLACQELETLSSEQLAEAFVAIK